MPAVGWAQPGVQADPNTYQYDLNERRLVPPGQQAKRGQTQFSFPQGWKPPAEGGGFGILHTPPGTPAPTNLVNYTPATSEVHDAGMLAPVQHENYSIVPHGKTQRVGMGQAERVGYGQSTEDDSGVDPTSLIDSILGNSAGSDVGGDGSDTSGGTQPAAAPATGAGGSQWPQGTIFTAPKTLNGRVVVYAILPDDENGTQLIAQIGTKRYGPHDQDTAMTDVGSDKSPSPTQSRTLQEWVNKQTISNKASPLYGFTVGTDPQTGEQMYRNPKTGEVGNVKDLHDGAKPGAPSGSGSAVGGAVDALTKDDRVRMSMRLGALLEGGNLNTPQQGWSAGDSGGSWGPYQINHNKGMHADIDKAGSNDPASASKYMLSAYEAAVEKVPPEMWKSDPQQAAAQAAFLAERPAKPYDQNRVSAAWNTVQQDLSGDGSGDSGAGGSGNPGGVPADAQSVQFASDGSTWWEDQTGNWHHNPADPNARLHYGSNTKGDYVFDPVTGQTKIIPGTEPAPTIQTQSVSSPWGGSYQNIFRVNPNGLAQRPAMGADNYVAPLSPGDPNSMFQTVVGGKKLGEYANQQAGEQAFNDATPLALEKIGGPTGWKWGGSPQEAQLNKIGADTTAFQGNLNDEYKSLMARRQKLGLGQSESAGSPDQDTFKAAQDALAPYLQRAPQGPLKDLQDPWSKRVLKKSFCELYPDHPLCKPFPRLPLPGGGSGAPAIGGGRTIYSPQAGTPLIPTSTTPISGVTGGGSVPTGQTPTGGGGGGGGVPFIGPTTGVNTQMDTQALAQALTQALTQGDMQTVTDLLGQAQMGSDVLPGFSGQMDTTDYPSPQSDVIGQGLSMPGMDTQQGGFAIPQSDVVGGGFGMPEFGGQGQMGMGLAPSVGGFGMPAMFGGGGSGGFGGPPDLSSLFGGGQPAQSDPFSYSMPGMGDFNNPSSISDPNSMSWADESAPMGFTPGTDIGYSDSSDINNLLSDYGMQPMDSGMSDIWGPADNGFSGQTDTTDSNDPGSYSSDASDFSDPSGDAGWGDMGAYGQSEEQPDGDPMSPDAAPGDMAPPVPPQDAEGIGSRFGETSPIDGQPHLGTDVQAIKGTPVLARADGVVVKVENRPMLGLTVIVRDKNGLEHTYGHLLAASVKPGQHVGKGQPIAQVGESGSGATGPNLHYSLAKNGRPVNPEPTMGGMGHLPMSPNTVGMGQSAPTGMPPQPQQPPQMPGFGAKPPMTPPSPPAPEHMPDQNQMVQEHLQVMLKLLGINPSSVVPRQPGAMPTSGMPAVPPSGPPPKTGFGQGERVGYGQSTDVSWPGLNLTASSPPSGSDVTYTDPSYISYLLQNLQLQEADEQARHNEAMQSATTLEQQQQETARHNQVQEQLAQTSNAFQQQMATAQLTGQYNGQSTQAADLQKANIAAQQAQLTGQYNGNPTEAAKEFQQSIFQQQLNSALSNPWLEQLTGMAPGYGQPGANAPASGPATPPTGAGGGATSPPSGSGGGAGGGTGATGPGGMFWNWTGAGDPPNGQRTMAIGATAPAGQQLTLSPQAAAPSGYTLATLPDGTPYYQWTGAGTGPLGQTAGLTAAAPQGYALGQTPGGQSYYQYVGDAPSGYAASSGSPSTASANFAGGFGMGANSPATSTPAPQDMSQGGAPSGAMVAPKQKQLPAAGFGQSEQFYPGGVKDNPALGMGKKPPVSQTQPNGGGTGGANAGSGSGGGNALGYNTGWGGGDQSTSQSQGSGWNQSYGPDPGVSGQQFMQEDPFQLAAYVTKAMAPTAGNMYGMSMPQVLNNLRQWLGSQGINQANPITQLTAAANPRQMLASTDLGQVFGQSPQEYAQSMGRQWGAASPGMAGAGIGWA